MQYAPTLHKAQSGGDQEELDRGSDEHSLRQKQEDAPWAFFEDVQACQENLRHFKSHEALHTLYNKENVGGRER